MSSLPGAVATRVGAARRYFATVGPLVRLVWRSGPLLFAGSLALTVAGGLLPAANIYLASALLDTLVRATRSANVGPDPLNDFAVLLVLLVAVNLVAQILEHVGAAVNQLQGTRITNRVQALIAQKAAEIDLEAFEDPEFHNKMQTASNEAPYRPKTLIDELMSVVSTLTTLVSLAAVLMLWQAWIVPAFLVASLATLWVSLRFGSALVELILGRAETERKKRYLSTLFVSDQAVKEIRLFGLHDLLLGRFRGLLETTYRQDRRLALTELAYSVPASVVLIAVQAAVITFAAFSALRGDISVGQFNLYTLSITQLGALLPELMSSVGLLHESNLFAASLFGFLSVQPRVEAPRPGSEANSNAISEVPRVAFRHVSFAYPGSVATVIDDVSFELRPGETVALVGENGSGKSTLVKLLAGLYEATEGRISMDGVDIGTLDRDALRARLSVIFQDYVIYHFSAGENIGVGQVDRLGDPDLIRRAAERSGLDRVIAGLPNGYDTVLGRFWENGHELSGGQRQLVALARALLRDAPILILDEPSAALDVYTEQQFFRRLLGDARRDRSVLFISHRFTTVRQADLILVLREGRLVERGTHAELLEKGGHYARMFDLQAAAYHDRPSPDGPQRETRRTPT